ncbi:ap-3 complex subunit sigma [Phtheirospermum japonicum]|uniref:Ap-3 complex subunit sigma n=1 Tax=Phtheirospermum japonicum TaxID=374723 RepID=A0A830CNB2_9LAMI|nr:ap-3 complex subunit sigma [Phtheirospermum japonicum]
MQRLYGEDNNQLHQFKEDHLPLDLSGTAIGAIAATEQIKIEASVTLNITFKTSPCFQFTQSASRSSVHTFRVSEKAYWNWKPIRENDDTRSDNNKRSRKTTPRQILSVSVLCSRAENVSNFVKVDSLFGPDVRLVHKTFATLYFVFIFDNAENELAMLDLMQVFVETLDKCFSNVCELDIVFNFKKVHTILDEIILGGQVLETSSSEVVKADGEQFKLNYFINPQLAGSIAAVNCNSLILLNLCQARRIYSFSDIATSSHLKSFGNAMEHDLEL